MWNDAVELRDFYATSLGRMAQRAVRHKLREMWPDIAGQSVLGLGYATPYLLSFREQAVRVIGVMPAGQGVLRWPVDGPRLVCLGDEAELPLPDLSIDRVLLVHALECTEQLRAMLREVWRVMSSDGRLLVVVPNRRGIWARFDHTPFGHGHPFTPGQLSRLLRDTLFTPVRTGAALYLPPSSSRMLLSTAPAWEHIGRRWFQTFAGVLMVEASKEVYAGTVLRAERRRRARTRVSSADAVAGR